MLFADLKAKRMLKVFITINVILTFMSQFCLYSLHMELFKKSYNYFIILVLIKRITFQLYPPPPTKIKHDTSIGKEILKT